MFCDEIGWHNLQIRQVSRKLADCAVQFANWPDWQIGRDMYINISIVTVHCLSIMQCRHVFFFFQRSAKHRMKHT